ncbi:RNA-binding protein, putative [Plasmodium gallinaceum]|uniref:RNA-binding protein, putative n=1 Tax=Plasmodium gallinaceum TaxID=5849 RepID=A0A1J1GSV7_PLAGA|nr:RNA-binding protein, putative [Plasmodium gallinaceum]CRG95580.1 RNA-binding protein, putative [Plasmodium gallinaceum]
MIEHNDAVDKHKVFVYNIKGNDLPLLKKEFENICNKHFFFSNKNLKSAICHFKSEKEAEDFISKYNGLKVYNSDIKCEFALKKKCEHKKLVSIIYNRQKIKYSNSIQIFTDYNLDCIQILSFLKSIFLKNKLFILSFLDDVKNEMNDEKKNSNENEDSENSIEIVVDKKLKNFEDIIINIKKENKNNNITKKKELKSQLINNKNINNYFVYTIEFITLKLASCFFKIINKNVFENYLKEKSFVLKNNFLFYHELCFLKRNDKKVILKNLSRTCHIENIKKLFKNIDKNIKIFFPKKDNKKQGCAFVYFSNKKNVQKALLLSNSKLCGNIISIERVNNNLDFLNNFDDNKENKNLITKEDKMKNNEKHFNEDNKNENDENENESEDDENEIEDFENEIEDENKENEDDDMGSEDDDKENEDDENEIEDDDKKNEEHNNINEYNGNENDIEEDIKYSDKNTRRHMNDVDEGKTLFITNIPTDTTSEEIKSYIENNISNNYIYIKTCRNNNKRISVFVKLKYKKDADQFLRKIGELEEEEKESDIEENVIEKFYKMEKRKKKEKMKKILLKDSCKNVNSEFLFFKNNYLMIKRAVRKDLIKDKKKFTMDKKKDKNKMDNNIHLIYDNNVNNENLSENIVKRNKKLMEKKKELLKNRNFLINPCRIYIRNYPAMLEQNTFRQLITKYFTPILMKKYNIKKKEAFKKSNEIIKKMKVVKENVNKDKNIEIEKTKNNKNIICFIDINKHENAKMLINFLQNKNIYELINEVIYKKKFQTIRKNKNIIYVDYCIEDVRMLHIKKLKTEKFLNHLKEKNININTKKTIKKKKKKTSRGRRQREKRRLLKLQANKTNISNVIQNKFVNEKTQQKFSNKINNNSNNKNELNNKRKFNSLEKNNNEKNNSYKIANNQKKITPKKDDNMKKLKVKKRSKQTDTKKNNNEMKSIKKDVLKFLKNLRK